MNDLQGGMSARVKIIRLRTWTLTLTILALLILYIFVTLSTKNKMDWIDFAITAAIQISTHFAYFPDGERYGEQDQLFIRARKIYNLNADRITQVSSIEKLRAYCDEEYEERKRLYIQEVCGKKIGISISELGVLRLKSKKEIKSLEKVAFSSGSVLYLTRARRKAIIHLIYGELPVEANSPDTILSAVDRDYAKAIKDNSKTYGKTAHARVILKALIVGLIFGYVGYSLRKGLTYEAAIKSAVFIGAMISTAVSSYIVGEKSTREYKKTFFVELSTFIDKFFSWTGLGKTPIPEE